MDPIDQDRTGLHALEGGPFRQSPPTPDGLPIDRLAAIEMVFFDCDGVLTDGRVWVDATGAETKAFSVVDGHGIAMLRQVGVRVGMLTRSPQGIATARASKLAFDVVRTSIDLKGRELLDVLADLRTPAEAVAYMGDDLPDIEAFQIVGLKLAPSTARPEIISMADAVTREPGGHGAVRAVCDAIIRARLATMKPR